MTATEPQVDPEPSTEVEVAQTSAELERHVDFTTSQVALLKKTIASGTSDDEFELFLAVCKRTGLDPFARQIFAIMRKDHGTPKMSIQISIDGFRLIAARTGRYTGQVGPEWCGPDGVWRDVWLSKEPPAAARVAVMRAGFVQPLYGVATMAEYRQDNKDGKANNFWSKFPSTMIAKVAESIALRKAFPAELSGLYTDDEMGQAGGQPNTVTTSTLGFWNDLVAEIRGDEDLSADIDIDDVIARMLAKASEKAEVAITDVALLPEVQVAAAWHKLTKEIAEIRRIIADATPNEIHDAEIVDETPAQTVDEATDPVVQAMADGEQPDPERPFTDD